MLSTKAKQVFKRTKTKKRNRCYSFSCPFPIRYVNGCPESKIMSLKHLYIKLLTGTSQFHVGSWHKLLKSKHCYFFNRTLPWMKIWRWWCSRYLRNHSFLLCEIFQCVVKFRYTKVIHKKLFFDFSWNAQLCLIFINMSITISW